MNKTKIEWCDYTWNPVTGCKHGCPYCYAERISKRFTGDFEPKFHEKRLLEPVKIKKPSRVFVVSMGDLFGEWVPDEWISEVMKACKQAPWHTYIFLSKNPKKYDNWVGPTDAWYGATVNNSADFIPPCRASDLFRTGIHNRFLSIEPLLGEIQGIALQNLTLFKWVIVGAQTGPGAVKPKTEWVQSIVNKCKEDRVPLFLKDNLGWHEEIKEFPNA